MGYDNEFIFRMLADHVQTCELFYSTDCNGHIDGVILFERRPDNLLFVTENLSMTMATLRKFAIMARERYPEHRLEWLKYGKHKHFNTNRFYQKLNI